ncbi:unnamed protein product [Durusdinium trenchii]|uniref:Metallo-beta-lactamase domain-containing protein n=1 Tax=Durusdinium trenchii TaxID=1381693 RepID=A0ABP0QIZ2_9DINO
MDVNLAAHFKHGRQQLEGLPSVAKLSDQVMVILGLNPGPYTLQGTNCYLIGRGRKRVLVDTGEGRAEFVESLVQVLHGEDCEITDVILTHTHVDHIGGLPDLVQRFPDLQVWRCQPASGLSFGQLGTAEDATDPAQTLGKCRQTRFRPLKNGEVLKLHGSTLKAIHTPGHANDHVCFWLEEEKALFTGDHILGTGTVIVQDLEAYMSSLELLHSFRPERIYPGHGPMLQGDAARNRPRDYIQHRHLRLKKALELLEVGARSFEQLLDGVYGSSLPADAFLRHAARRNLEASLEKLQKDGLARRLSAHTWGMARKTSTNAGDKLQDRQKASNGYAREGELRGVLQRARPQWSTKDLAAAEAKLLSIGICTAEKLAEQLAASVLNDNLRSGGFRAFAAETLQALREAVPESETVD